MLSYRLGTVNDFHWGFKPVFRYSKPHTFVLLRLESCIDASNNFVGDGNVFLKDVKQELESVSIDN